MNSKIRYLWLICFFVFAAWALVPSRLRKAFEHHEHLESPEVRSYYPQIGGEDVVFSERWKNYQRYAKLCPQIAEVTSIVISKTPDSAEYVITLRGPDAHQEWPKGNENYGFERDTCSLWIAGSVEGQELQVRDFTAY